ncbi:hypothetical protein Salat_1398800 [Sesamum alatum]|uniref:Uncharacterized protein n=1 Tax=Sesamum alatum TaxID=300844 RepID=A0AAE2CL96_9LAMI|nr:hypothetical protein Salat_1398800 [Sesamum alatum]
MKACIANKLRAKKGTLPPNVAPLIDSSFQGASSAPRGRSSGNLGDSSAPLEPAPAISPVAPASIVPPIEIPSEDTEVAGEEVQSTAYTKPYTAKSLAEKAKSKAKRKAKQATDKEEEGKHLKLVAELTECWKGTRAELRTPKCVSAEMEGEKLVPDWAISAQSSVLKTHVGQDSWELYKACLLAQDQATLVPTAHV